MAEKTGRSGLAMPDAINLERMCLPVTLKCNLLCELCAERSPYYENPYHPSLEDLVGEVDSLFRIVDRVGKFDLTGGEPFLRLDLPAFIEYLGRAHGDGIGKLRIVTNGSLLPPDGLAAALAAWPGNALVIVDNYRVSAKSGQVCAILRQAAIPCELRDYRDDPHCGGWVDYGDLTQKRGLTEARKTFAACAAPRLGFFTCLVNGLLFPCARARLLYEAGLANVAMDANDPGLSENGKRRRLRALLGDEAVEACRFCNGLSDDAPRFAPAEQLPARPRRPERINHYRHLNTLFVYTQTYNNEKTIGRTIESVLAQTDGDFTHFIVDNGSTDRTGEIIAGYAARDRRLAPLRCRYNDLLATFCFIPLIIGWYARGEIGKYFTVLDGDDVWRPNFVETVLRLAKRHDSDMIVSGFRRIDAGTGTITGVRSLSRDTLVAGGQKADRFPDLRPLLLCQWGKVYKRKFIKKPIGHFANAIFSSLPPWTYQLDTVGVLLRFYQAKSAVFTGEPLYDYFQQPASTANTYSAERFASDQAMLRIYRLFLERFGPVDKLNDDYLYAVYLSLVEDSVKALFRANLAFADQARETLKILRAGETRAMLARDADPRFRNLADRGRLLRDILAWLAERDADGEAAALAGEIRSEIGAWLAGKPAMGG